VRRDPRLQGPSSEHHRGLLLARRVERASRGGADPALAARIPHPTGPLAGRQER
jgi:hypothetical protein